MAKPPRPKPDLPRPDLNAEDHWLIAKWIALLLGCFTFGCIGGLISSWWMGWL